MTQAMEKPKIVKLTEAEMDALFERVRSNTLSPNDQNLVCEVFQNQHWLYNLLEFSKINMGKLKAMLFGSSEKRRKDKGIQDPRDNPDVEPANDPAPFEKDEPDDNTSSNSADTSDDKVKGHGRSAAFAYVNRQQVLVNHPTLKSGDPCPEPPCPGRLYTVRPGTFVQVSGQSIASATEYILEKLRCSACGVLVTAPLPSNSASQKYDVNFKSVLALERYFLAVPFCRQAAFQKMLGLPLAASTQWELMEEVLNALIPIFIYLEYLTAQSEVIHNDDTGAKILSVIAANKSNPEQKRTGMFTTGIVGFADQYQIMLFYSSRKHAGENLTELLKYRQPHLPPLIHMCDALSANLTNDDKVIVCHCLAHARRKFVQVEKQFPKECAFVIEQIGLVYKHEKEIKVKKLSKVDRLHYHQKYSKSVLDDLYHYLNEQSTLRKTEPNSGLGQAITYAIKHWEALTRFLTVEGAPIDNNINERGLKMPIRNRKNSLFHGTEYSAKAASTIMSVIYTCHANDINPLPYLNALQNNKSAVTLNPEKWLPWNYTDVADTPTQKAA